MQWFFLASLVATVALTATLLVAVVAKLIAHIPIPAVRRCLVIAIALTISAPIVATAFSLTGDADDFSRKLGRLKNQYHDLPWLTTLSVVLLVSLVLSAVVAGICGLYPARTPAYLPGAAEWRISRLSKWIGIAVGITCVFLVLNDFELQWRLANLNDRAIATSQAMAPRPISSGPNAVEHYQRGIDEVKSLEEQHPSPTYKEVHESLESGNAVGNKAIAENFERLAPFIDALTTASTIERFRIDDANAPLHILDGREFHYGVIGGVQRLVQLAKYRLQQGDIEGALDLAELVRVIERHWLQDPRNRRPLFFWWYERWILQLVEAISMRDDVSSQQLARLRSDELSIEKLSAEGAKWEQAAIQAYLASAYSGKEFDRPELQDQEVFASGKSEAVMARWLTAATLRFLYARDDMHALNAAFVVDVGPAGETVGFSGDDLPDGKLFWRALSTEYFPYRSQDAECERRLIEVGVAAITYKNDHGNWPPKLEALVPQYLDKVLVDPFTESPFLTLSISDGVVFYSAERTETFAQFDDSDRWWQAFNEYPNLCISLGSAAQRVLGKQ